MLADFLAINYYGGGSKSIIIAAINLLHKNAAETINSLNSHTLGGSVSSLS